MLTKDAKTMLFVFYKEYKLRRKNNLFKSKSKNFDSAQYVHETLFPNLALEDVEDTMRELGRNKFLNNVYLATRFIIVN